MVKEWYIGCVSVTAVMLFPGLGKVHQANESLTVVLWLEMDTDEALEEDGHD